MMGKRKKPLSQPIENFLDGSLKVDTLIVGSGYGAAMAALALRAETKNFRVCVFERGKEYVPGEFPETIGSFPGHLSIKGKDLSFGKEDALWDLRMGDGVSTVIGRGLGGGSLINASVAFEPPMDLLEAWPRASATSQPLSWGDWKARFLESQAWVEGILGAKEYPDSEKLKSLEKYKALESLVDQLDESCTVQPAKLTLQFEDGKNHVGVLQNKCIDCGNCVTGCNTGAKGSLDMNAWPLASSSGIEIYTGAGVRSLARSEDDQTWLVNIQLTYDKEKSFQVQARRVILAAGTMGSTEILKRSDSIGLSRGQLGKRFSGNGDMLGFGEGRKSSVASVATEASTLGASKDTKIGPTILGYAQISGRPGPSFLLEEGAVPYPVRRIVDELLTTQNLVSRLSDGKLPAWFEKGNGEDPLASSLKAGKHHPIHLVMGRDGGQGTLDLVDDTLLPTWPAADEVTPQKPFFEDVALALKNAGKALAASELGKTHKKEKKSESPIRELDAVNRQLVTVHPLGGCCLADRAENGVVDPNGAVFSGESGTAVHEGLYVLDGSILPEALGVNPFLTIGSLAHFLASQIPALDSSAAFTEGPVADELSERREPRSGDPVLDPGDEVVDAEFNERLFLKLDDPSLKKALHKLLQNSCPAQVDPLTRSLEGATALVMDATLHVPDVFQWVAHPSQPIQTSFTLSAATVEFGDTAPTTALRELGVFEGSVILGALDTAKAASFRGVFRRIRVIGTFLRLRGGELWAGFLDTLREELFPRPRIGKDKRALITKLLVGLSDIVKMLFEKTGLIWRIAGVHADRRSMIYRFEDEELVFEGTKDISYVGKEPDPLKVLRELPFTLRQKGASKRSAVSATLRVDLIRFTGEPAALQLRKTPDSPSSAMAMASLGLFLARGVLQSMFWSFRRPVYSRFGDKEAENTPRLQGLPKYITFSAGSSSRSEAKLHAAELDIEIAGWMSVSDKEKSRSVRLARYRALGSGSETRKAALLIHGLAHGSRVFWTDTIETPLLKYLLREGYDVWLLDHSLSTNLRRFPNTQISMDDLAAEDLPWAVRNVYDRTGDKVHVFAHCIGAGAFAMATLSGRLQVDSSDPSSESMVESVVIHAVTPWMVASEDNRWRANALSLYKDQLVKMGYFDPIPHQEPAIAESLYDALAGSFSHGDSRHRHEGDDRGDQFSRTICNRMTLFYGTEWVHENLAEETHIQLATLVGPGSLRILRQANFCIIRGRLTGEDGQNEYLQEDGFRHWSFRTLFLHGDQNKVFDCESSKRSAVELRKMVARQQTDQKAAPLVSSVVVPGYGHMDVLFGRNAHREIYPAILRCFENDAQDESQKNPEPRASSGLGTKMRAVVGPIISRPRVKDEKMLLRVWAASNDLSTVPGEALCFEELNNQALKRKRARATLKEPQPKELPNFWLGDVVVDPKAGPSQGTKSKDGEFIATEGGAFAERRPEPLSFNELPWFRRAFEKAPARSRLSFLVGSCLYPGLGSEQDLSDKIFETMRPHIEGVEESELSPEYRGVDHLLLVGDQIYADAMGDAFDPTSSFERYRKRYRAAFGGSLASTGKNAQWVLSHVPSYFAIDDHEIRDNWQSPAQTATDKRVALDEAALDEAFNYQIHKLADENKGTSFSYDFEGCGVPFFVLDTRSERKEALSRDDAEALLSSRQRDSFEAWLAKRSKDPTLPLFVVSGSVMGPIKKAIEAEPELVTHGDTLLAYPGFLLWLIKALKDVKNPIVWLAGDLHSSSVSELELQRTGGSPPISITQVVASGLFSPLPFVNTNSQSYETHQLGLADGSGAHRRIKFERKGVTVTALHHLLADNCQSNFVRIDLDGRELRVRAFRGDLRPREAAEAAAKREYRINLGAES